MDVVSSSITRATFLSSPDKIAESETTRPYEQNHDVRASGAGSIHGVGSRRLLCPRLELVLLVDPQDGANDTDARPEDEAGQSCLFAVGHDSSWF